jgi:hypothetical protein
VVKHLPSTTKAKALGAIPSTNKKKKKELLKQCDVVVKSTGLEPELCGF